MSIHTAPPRLLTLQDAADLLNVSSRFVRAAAHEGLITTVRLGRLVRFRQEDLEAYLTRHSVAAEETPSTPTAGS